MEEKNLKKINRYKTTIEISLALFIFIWLYINDKILQEVSFFKILVAFLSFIILVEVIRMLGGLLLGLFLFILAFFFRGKSLKHSKMKEEIDLCASCDKKGLKNEY